MAEIKLELDAKNHGGFNLYDEGTKIGEMAVAIANELTIDCIHNTVHAHPTLPEAWMEAALIASGQPLHIPPKK